MAQNLSDVCETITRVGNISGCFTIAAVIFGNLVQYIAMWLLL